MAPSPNRLTAAGTQTTGKHVRDVASSRPLILGGRHQPDYALTPGTFADTARPAGVWPLGPGGRSAAQSLADHRSVADLPVRPVARPMSAHEAPAASAARTAWSSARAAVAWR